MKFSAAFVAVALGLLQFAAAVPVEETAAMAEAELAELAALPVYRDRDDDDGPHPPVHPPIVDPPPVRPPVIDPPPIRPPPIRPPPRANCPLDPVPKPKEPEDCLELKAQLSDIFVINYRAKHNHFYTPSAESRERGLRAGATAEGIPFQLFRKPAPGTVPVHRLFHEQRNDHTFSVSKPEIAKLTGEGWKDEGPFAHALTNPGRCGAMVIKRLYKHAINQPKIYPGGRAYDNWVNVFNHFMTMDMPYLEKLKTQGWKEDGTMAFGFPPGTGQAARKELQELNQRNRNVVAAARIKALKKQNACLAAFGKRVAAGL
ncbi:hypothetical protein HGRIS_006853 [Hohenbuehelia grisea]|uniref:DUF5648 domain-containing protein n=1 Tax=Hohenbuehelia grisea TaxID=104357 RepID=A0ABR3JAY7_9AGAR